MCVLKTVNYTVEKYQQGYKLHIQDREKESV